MQLSRRADGQWEAALLTPTQTPLAVLGVAPGGAPGRLQALYSPTGEATETRQVADGYAYPKTWAGYLKYPDLGQRGETAGLYDAGARLYAPTWGQFLEGDPILPDPAAPETWGRYAYGGGDTIGMWDPEGRFAWVPVLAALAWWGASTVVDVWLDAAAAQALGEEFSFARSLFVNGAINAATAGLGGKLKHLEKLSYARRLFARAGIDAAVTTTAEATWAGVNGEQYDLGAGLAGNLLGGVLGGAAGDLAAAGVGRVGRSQLADRWRSNFGEIRASRAEFMAGGGQYLGSGGGNLPALQALNDGLVAGGRAVGRSDHAVFGVAATPQQVSSNPTWTSAITPWQRRVHQRSDIDWDLVRPDGVAQAGMTNWQAARLGHAPGRVNPASGKWDDVVLHHLNQDARGSLAELWRTTHGRVPHKMGPHAQWRADRPDWAKAWNNEHAAYWKWRTGSYNPAPTSRLQLPGDP